MASLNCVLCEREIHGRNRSFISKCGSHANATNHKMCLPNYRASEAGLWRDEELMFDCSNRLVADFTLTVEWPVKSSRF